MKKCFILFLFFASMLYAQNNPNENFGKYFEFVKEIRPPDDFILGDFSSVDVYEDKIVIVDRFMGYAYLINDKGKLLKKLDPDECHPGLNWKPQYAYFNKQGNIYIVFESPTWGFLFGKEGKCIGLADKTFVRSNRMAFLSNKKIVVYNPDKKVNHNSLLIMDEKGKYLNGFGSFPDQFLNLIDHTDGGGLVTDKNDNIYQLHLTSCEIAKYNSNGKIIKTFKCKPEKFIQPLADDSGAPITSIDQIQNNMKKVGNFTSAQKLYLLADDILAAEYWNKGTIELVLCDLEGRKLNLQPITYKRVKSLLAKNGLIYFFYQGEKDRNGNIPNPVIKVYKFKTDMKWK